MLFFINYTKTENLSLLRSAVVVMLLLLLLAGTLTSCTKDKEDQGTASLIVVNAVPGSRPLVKNFEGSGQVLYKKSITLPLYYNVFEAQYNLLSSYSGNQRIRLFQYPDTTEKDVPLFDLRLDLPVGSMRSLYLTGTVDAPDTVFVKDEIPGFGLKDSAIDFQFINLSKGSRPISVNIQGEPNGTVLNGLAYKKWSGFQRYAATMKITKYVFEFRDAVTGDLITTYETDAIHGLNSRYWLFRSHTLAFIGVPGGTGGNEQKILRVEHFRLF